MEGEVDRGRLHALLRTVLDRPRHERAAFLQEVSDGDLVLGARLRDLLHAVEDVTEEGSIDRSGTAQPSAPASVEPTDQSGPPLAPGQRLGRYEILDLLGAGGMGTVYRALDPGLGREVAIKALARAFRGDSGSLRRFEREARVLATLSHPNIASIYGFERLDGSPYLVLERVEGETLAQRIARGPMPLREAVGVGVQIIEGLEEAHDKGVIHRDLKPSNVMLGSSGRAKLVDFGLAKTHRRRTPAGAAAEPTITATGTVIGTARYMSPEQVRGDDVDTRTDVWSFGCVLYEMLSGRAAFPEGSLPEVLAAVLRDDPDWSALPADVPGSVRRLLRRCLRRDPRMRLQHIGDARLELSDDESDVPAPAEAAPPSRLRRALPWTAAGCALAAATASIALAIRSGPGPRRPVRLSLELPAPVALGSDYAAPFALVPGASSIVVGAVDGSTRRLYVRGFADLALRPLAGTEGAREAFVSPDGGWVAFFADRRLSKVPLDGGPVLAIADIGGNPRGATWAEDGSIIVAPSQTSGLARVSDRGGRVSRLTTLDPAGGESTHRWPAALPGGAWVVFTVGFEDASFDEGRIEAVSLQTGERRPLVAGAGYARYAPGGRLLFVRGGRVYAVAFDPAQVAVRGQPEVVLDAIRYDPRNGGSHLDVSAAGVLAYTPGDPATSDRYLAWIDRAGTLSRIVDTPRPFREPRVSPEGRRIAAVVGTSSESDLWIVDVNGTLSRLSFGLAPHRPAWTPDGRHITVGAARDGRWRLLSVPADGGAPIVLHESPDRVYPGAWVPGGRQLVFQERRVDTGWDLRVVDVGLDGRPVGSPRDLAVTPFHESTAAVSPDGRWIAYESDEVDGVVQIYGRSFPDGGHKVRLSPGGARWPAWGPAGELFYWVTGEGLMQVAHTRQSGEMLSVSRVESMWPADGADRPGPKRMYVSVAGARFDVHPSGARVLTLESVTAPAPPALLRPVIALDWTAASSPR